MPQPAPIPPKKLQPIEEKKQPPVSYSQLHKAKRSSSQHVVRPNLVGASKYGGLAQPLIPQKLQQAAPQQPVVASPRMGGGQIIKKTRGISNNNIARNNKEQQQMVMPNGREDKIVVNTSKGFDGLLFELPQKKEEEPEEVQDTYNAEEYRKQVESRPFKKPTINRLR